MIPIDEEEAPRKKKVAVTGKAKKVAVSGPGMNILPSPADAAAQLGVKDPKAWLDAQPDAPSPIRQQSEGWQNPALTHPVMPQGAGDGPGEGDAWRTITDRKPQGTVPMFDSADQALRSGLGSALQTAGGKWIDPAQQDRHLSESTNPEDQRRYMMEALSRTSNDPRVRMMFATPDDPGTNKANAAAFQLATGGKGAGDLAGMQMEGRTKDKQAEAMLGQAGVSEYGAKVTDPLKIMAELEKTRLAGEYEVRKQLAQNKGMTGAAATQALIGGAGDLSQYGTEEFDRRMTTMGAAFHKLQEQTGQGAGDVAPVPRNEAFERTLGKAVPWANPGAMNPITMQGAMPQVAVTPKENADDKAKKVVKTIEGRLPSETFNQTVLGIAPGAGTPGKPVDYEAVRKLGVKGVLAKLAEQAPERIDDEHLGQLVKHLTNAGFTQDQIRATLQDQYVKESRAMRQPGGAGKYKIDTKEPGWGTGGANKITLTGPSGDVYQGVEPHSILQDINPLQGLGRLPIVGSTITGIGRIPAMARGTEPMMHNVTGSQDEASRKTIGAAERALEYMLRKQASR